MMVDGGVKRAVARGLEDVGQDGFAPTPSGSRKAGWAVVETYSRDEMRAAQGLEEQRFECYVPRSLNRRNRLEPLFPGYFFVWLEPETQWRPIRFTAGVVDLLRNPEGVPHILEAGVVEELKSTESLRHRKPSEQWLDIGSRCVVSGGGLDGHDGVLLSVGKWNVIVAMMLFGQLRRVSVEKRRISVYIRPKLKGAAAPSAPEGER